MQKPDIRFSLQLAVFALVLPLALFLRLYHLGSAPLSDFESRSALQARALLNGETPVLGAQPLTLMAQATAFFLLGEHNFSARLASALLGALLCVLPWFWRRALGERAAFLLAFGLACAPGLVAVSRLAGGPAPALTLGAAALTAWYAAPQGALFGLLAGLFLAGGPWAWSGLLGFALAWGLARLSGILPAAGLQREDAAPFEGRVLWGGALALLLGSTLFLRFPAGLGALAQSLSAWGRAFSLPSGVPFLRLLAALFWQHLLAAFLGLGGAVLAWKRASTTGRFALLWVLTALLMGLLLSGRQVMDAAWALLPLYILAASALDAALGQLSWRWHAGWGFAILTVVLGAVAWLSMAGMPASDLPLADTWQRWGMLGAVLAVWLISALLVGMGWRWAAPVQGGALGLTLFLGMLLLSQAWPGSAHEQAVTRMWHPAPHPARLDVLLRTLGDAAEYQNGRRDSLQVRLDVDSASLAWALRDYAWVDSAGTLPPAAITPQESTAPDAQVVYRAQKFAWQITPAWNGALPPNATRWFIFGEVPSQIEYVTLWLRGDLFPGGSVIPVTQETEPLTP